MTSVSSPSAGKDRAPDTVESLGAVNISVSKVTGGQETVSPLCSPLVNKHNNK